MSMFDFPRSEADWSDAPAWCRWWPARCGVLAVVVALSVGEYFGYSE